ncbi:MAG: hypothetical protein K2K21_16990 [Lachnospiraceae bacterium]|nr:hypothetical protein [Lachnospiraceae bacterium]
MTALYSVWHLLVDGLCAIAMFGKFIPNENGYFSILIYNFCAFALQMPFGVLLDAMNARDEKQKFDFSFLTAAIGVICTAVGAYTNPVILGIGNALFHIGGGVGTIHDRFGAEKSKINNRLIVRLGIFVAPGAIGLYLGTLLANAVMSDDKMLWTSVGMLLCVIVSWFALRRRGRKTGTNEEYVVEASVAERIYDVADFTASSDAAIAGNRYGIAAICLIVVVLRSYIGMSVGFSWKTGIAAGLLAVLALACGKTAGGFLAARYGLYRTAVVSLMLASVCYLFSSIMPVGLAALFLFNMTMPITLYWVICAFPRMPGFAFGVLTFALFLGFLPKYMEIEIAIGGNVIGCVGSILSLLLISVGIMKFPYVLNRIKIFKKLP